MAVAIPGALYSSISGRVAGTVHRADPRGQVIGAPGAPRRRASALQTQQRLALARASLTWRTLSAADRTAWDQYALSVTIEKHNGDRRPANGFELYCAAVALAQPAALTAAAPPFAPGQNPGLTPLTQISAAALYLTGYSRDLITNESAIFRVTQVAPTTQRNHPPRILRSVTTNATQGLAGVDGFAFNFPAGPNPPTRTGSISVSTSHTVEHWIKIPTGQANGRAIWRSNFALQNANYNGIAQTIELRSGGVTTLLGAYPNDAAWHHVAISMSAAAAQAIYYLDGAAVGAPIVYTGGTWTSDFRIGAADAAGSAGINAAFEEFVIWDTVRTPAEIAASYNAGLGHRYTSADGARVILHFDTLTGSTLLDSSGNNLNFTAATGSLILTPFARLLSPATDVRYTPGTQWVFASPYIPARPYSRPTLSPIARS